MASLWLAAWGSLTGAARTTIQTRTASTCTALLSVVSAGFADPASASICASADQLACGAESGARGAADPTAGIAGGTTGAGVTNAGPCLASPVAAGAIGVCRYASAISAATSAGAGIVWTATIACDSTGLANVRCSASIGARDLSADCIRGSASAVSAEPAEPATGLVNGAASDASCCSTRASAASSASGCASPVRAGSAAGLVRATAGGASRRRPGSAASRSSGCTAPICAAGLVKATAGGASRSCSVACRASGCAGPVSANPAAGLVKGTANGASCRSTCGSGTSRASGCAGAVCAGPAARLASGTTVNTALGSIAAAANDTIRRADAATAAEIAQSTTGSRIRHASALFTHAGPTRASAAGCDAPPVAPRGPAATSLVANRTRTASLTRGTTGGRLRVAVGGSVLDRSIHRRSIHGQSIRGLGVSSCATSRQCV